MIKEITNKRCLVLSYGPVPTPEQDKVEGGGLRCWGLAKGLRANDPDLSITVAYHDSYKKEKFTDKYEDINITTWESGSVHSLISDYDSVIVSYCMGELTNLVVEFIKPSQQLILDCYVPIYVEISARESADLAGEFAAFNHEVANWAKALKRGDLFLCASPSQKRYYQGVLSALGRINPATYSEELILIAPYGIYRDTPVATERPITKLIGSDDKTKRLLWFGAIYPWFDLRTLVDAVALVNKKVPLKLVIVGAKNPFNDHPAFVGRYNQLIEHIDKTPQNKKNIIIQEWVEFSDRANWYLDCDLVILINKIGEENELAWRTRLVDFIWADLPIATNGGDPLGEELINNNAAAKLIKLDAEGLAGSLTKLLEDEKALASLKSNIKGLREKYYWDNVTKALHKNIVDHTRPQDFTQFGQLESHQSGSNAPASITRRVGNKAKMLPAYYRKYGARNTYFALRTTLLNQKPKVGLKTSTEPRVVFVSHQLDMTGGPLVFIDLVAEFHKNYPKRPLMFHTFNPAESENIKTLNKIGVKPRVHLSKEIAFTFNQGDVVVLNTVAYSKSFLSSLFKDLKTGTVKKLVWYIHEDEPEMIFSKSQQREIKPLIKSGKIIIYTPAINSTKNYQEYFDSTKNIRKQYYRLNVPKSLYKTRKPKDFERINFVLPGMVGDGRKGQLPIFYAFSFFKHMIYDKQPEKYRQFDLAFIGLGDDFYSRQILKHAQKSLGSHFKHYQKADHDKTLELIKEANVSICYSLRECLPIGVFEGMIAGHPILRNDCSGLEEQLIEGKNGFELDSGDVFHVVDTIGQILDKTKVTNEQLAAMSQKSQQIADGYTKLDFKDIIDEII